MVYNDLLEIFEKVWGSNRSKQIYSRDKRCRMKSYMSFVSLYTAVELVTFDENQAYLEQITIEKWYRNRLKIESKIKGVRNIELVTPDEEVDPMLIQFINNIESMRLFIESYMRLKKYHERIGYVPEEKHATYMDNNPAPMIKCEPMLQSLTEDVLNDIHDMGIGDVVREYYQYIKEEEY